LTIAERLRAFAPGDAHQPGTDLGLLPKLRQGFPGCHEHLLRYLFSERLAEPQDTVAKDKVLAIAQQCFEHFLAIRVVLQPLMVNLHEFPNKAVWDSSSLQEFPLAS